MLAATCIMHSTDGNTVMVNDYMGLHSWFTPRPENIDKMYMVGRE